MWLRAVEFVVVPSSGLLDSQSSPFLDNDRRYGFSEETAAGDLLIDIAGEDDMTVLIVVVVILVGVLDFIRVMRHFKP